MFMICTWNLNIGIQNTYDFINKQSDSSEVSYNFPMDVTLSQMKTEAVDKVIPFISSTEEMEYISSTKFHYKILLDFTFCFVLFFFFFSCLLLH